MDVGDSYYLYNRDELPGMNMFLWHGINSLSGVDSLEYEAVSQV